MKYFASFFILVMGLSPLAAAAQVETDDTYLDEQWYLDQISAKDAWETRTDASEITVAIIDGGVYYNHPDIMDNIWVNAAEEIDFNDEDDNGYTDDIIGWDFVDWDNDPSPDPLAIEVDESALHHGTVVAGIIGAIGDNGEGIAGIAWDINLMILRALDSVGSGTGYDVADAVYYAVDNGADIINLSLTGYERVPELEVAIEYANANGVIIIAAAGNEDVDTDIETVYPSCLRTTGADWVIGVTATDFDDQKAEFSNYGSECSDISAPGVGVFASIYEDFENGYIGEYTGGWAGTSFAAPMVAGAAALLLAEYPNLTPEQVQLALEIGADPLELGDEYQGKLGTGRLNVDKAFDVGQIYSDLNNQNGASAVRYISGESFPEVYRIIAGKRYVYMDTQTYFTWEESFDVVEEVPDAYLADYDFGGVMLPKSGTVLVKVQSVEKVYLLEEDFNNPLSATTLRHIESEEIAAEMYGEDWADYVIDVPSGMARKFVYGETVSEPEPLTMGVDLIKREELARRAQ